ncbi:MAG: hypothetical protein FWF96_03730, partial [Kiritimatiellaeota bacterium]|nr:hypothetical protein [Kiritimatiellota bacterium]
MKKIITSLAVLAAFPATFAQSPRLEYFKSDAETGISPFKLYTHAVDFSDAASGTISVQGVDFSRVKTTGGTHVAAFDNNPYTWSGFPPQCHNGRWDSQTPNPGEEVYQLMDQFAYVNAYAESDLLIGGLVPDAFYEVVLYFGAWDNAPILDFYFDPDGEAPPPIRINLRNWDERGDRRIVHQYKAPGDGVLKIHVEKPKPGDPEEPGNTRG